MSGAAENVMALELGSDEMDEANNGLNGNGTASGDLIKL
jgi:hypothetical protein